MDQSSRRRAMLEEMGLAPQWQRRAAGGTPASAEAQGEAPVDVAARDAARATGAVPVPVPDQSGGPPAADRSSPPPQPAPLSQPQAAAASAQAGAARVGGRSARGSEAAPSDGEPERARPSDPSPASPAPARASSARAAGILALDWDPLAAEVSGCTACPLSRTRRCTVFGTGDRRARWMFVGEGPGAEEDATGLPFVGQAGRLLDSMLAALGLARDRDVYIANIVKCRPPGNRVPAAEEVAACEPYLHRQIELVSPALIIALGKTAAVTLLGREQSIASMRGQVFRYRDTPLVVTYHPAYLLRNLPEKAKSWEDLCFARSLVRAASGESGVAAAVRPPLDEGGPA